jgi:hypothetical protein
MPSRRMQFPKTLKNRTGGAATGVPLCLGNPVCAPFAAAVAWLSTSFMAGVTSGNLSRDHDDCLQEPCASSALRARSFDVGVGGWNGSSYLWCSHHLRHSHFAAIPVRRPADRSVKSAAG